jgi:hypothetical protein
VPDTLLLCFLAPAQCLPPPYEPLQLGGRTCSGVCQQLRFVLGRRCSGECPDLGERQLAPGHRVGDEWQMLERPGRSDLLVRRIALDTDLPGQPLGARSEALALPVPVTIRLCERRQELTRRCSDLTEQQSDPLHALKACVRGQSLVVLAE